MNVHEDKNNICSIFINNGEKTTIKIVINLLIILFAFIFIVYSIEKTLGVSFDFSFIYTYKVAIMAGFYMTFKLGITSFIISCIIGIVTAFWQKSKIIILNILSNIYVTLIRGTPLIMQIYIFYYMVGTSLNLDNKFISGILILSIFEGAYIAEIIRGAINGLDKEEIEAGKAVGFTKWQSIRFVIIPQFIKLSLPSLTGQFASIIKDSSLLSIIAVIELTQTIREITSINYRLFEGYIVLGILYLVFTLPISFISKVLERRCKYEA